MGHQGIVSFLYAVAVRIVTCMCVYRRGCGLDIGFIDYLRAVTTNNYTAIATSTLYKIRLSLLRTSLSLLVVAW
jgi:hypothetical protein